MPFLKKLQIILLTHSGLPLYMVVKFTGTWYLMYMPFLKKAPNVFYHNIVVYQFMVVK